MNRGKDEAPARPDCRYLDPVKHFQVVTCELAPDGTTLFVNDATTKITGYRPDELLGRNWWDIFFPGEQRRQIHDFLLQLHSGDVADYQTILTTKDGSLKTLSWTSDNQYQPDGTLLRIIALGLDVSERSRAQGALGKSESKYRSLLENMVAGFAYHRVLFDESDRPVDYVFLEINRAFEELTGLRREDILGRRVTEAIPGIEKAEFDWIGTYGRVALTGGEVRFDRYMELLGRWCSVSAYSPVRGYFVAIFSDITERKRAEEALRVAHGELEARVEERTAELAKINEELRREIAERKRAEQELLESERKYRELVDSLPEAIFELDEKGQITFANPTTYRMFGGTPEESGKSIHVLNTLASTDVQRAESNIRRQLSGEDLGGQEYEFQRRDGTTFPGMVYSRRIIRDGKACGVRGLIVDISERKRAEEERERRLAREQALARIGQALVSESELERVAAVVMEQSVKVLGVDAVCLWLARPTRRHLRLLAQCGLEAPSANTVLSYDNPTLSSRAAKTEQMQIVEDVSLGQDLPRRSHQMIAQAGMRSLLALPLLSKEHLVGVVTYLTREPRRFSRDDIDFYRTIGDLFAVAIENARLHSALANRERQISLLLKETIDAQEEERRRIRVELHDGVAQSLTAASHYLQVLDGHPELPGGVALQIESVTTLVREAIRQAREVLATLRSGTLDTLGLVETLRHELTDVENRTGMNVDFAADPVHLPRETETTLYRITREAINNVVKHSLATAITTRIKTEQGRIAIIVEDDGIGFDLLVLEDKVHPKGFGLLSMRKRAEMLGGRLVVESSPDQGTRILVEAPLFVESQEPNALGDVSHSASRDNTSDDERRADPITVLIVDDHPISRDGLRAVLDRSGLVQVVGEAGDGLEAVQAVAELRPRVVLMDIRMPKLDGIEATRQIKARYPTTAVIVTTNYDDEALVVGAVQAGAAGYLLKDATRELVMHTIKGVTSGGTLIEAPLLGRAIDSLAQPHLPYQIPTGEHPEAQNLTERERQVLELLPKGWTNKEISKHLVISEATVKKHVQSIIAKLNASDRTHAATLALRLGLAN